MDTSNLKPFFKKRVWLVYLIGLFCMLTFPVSATLCILIVHRQDYINFAKEVWSLLPKRIKC